MIIFSNAYHVLFPTLVTCSLFTTSPPRSLREVHTHNVFSLANNTWYVKLKAWVVVTATNDLRHRRQSYFTLLESMSSSVKRGSGGTYDH